MLKILIVDDSKAVHAYVTSTLSSFPLVLTHVFNGQEALDLLATNKDFDLILMDWEMPVLDGPSTFDQLKIRQNAIPVLMMTTRNSLDDITLMIEKGVSEYVIKPFTTDILIGKIEQVLEKDIANVA